MKSFPQRKFCEAIVVGLRSGEAYALAYPDAAPSTRWTGGARLLARADVQAQIARLRAAADLSEGSAVLTLIDKRRFLARVVRARAGLLTEVSDLWQRVRVTDKRVRFRLPDKLRAIRLDNLLAGACGKHRKAREEMQEQEDAIRELCRRARASQEAWNERHAGAACTSSAGAAPEGAKFSGGDASPAKDAQPFASPGILPAAQPAEPTTTDVSDGRGAGGRLAGVRSHGAGSPDGCERIEDARPSAAMPGFDGPGTPSGAASAKGSETSESAGATNETRIYFAGELTRTPSTSSESQGGEPCASPPEPARFTHHSVRRPPGAVPAVCRGRTLMKKMAPGRAYPPPICNARSGRRKERLVIQPPREGAPDGLHVRTSAGSANRGKELRAISRTHAGPAVPGRALSGPQRKFCEGIAAGLSATDAYAAAYPRATRRTARSAGPALLASERIRSEVGSLRAKAAELAGTGVLGVDEKRNFLARVVLAKPARLGEDSDLWQGVDRSEGGVDLSLPDKLRAIAVDNEFEEAEAPGHSELVAHYHEIIRRVRSRPWPPPPEG